MSKQGIIQGFVRGLATGIACAVLVVLFLAYILNMTDLISISVVEVPDIQLALYWAYDNLRLSVIPFSLTLIFYFRALKKLKSLLESEEEVSPDRIAQAEHILDILITLFFGIGIIWTAIGMRSALLQALEGLTASSAAEMGAFTILQRLVDGGIVLALSTTIFGAVGGYVLRLLKALSVGSKLQGYYARLAAQEREEVAGRLERIENYLASLAQRGQDSPVGAEIDTGLESSKGQKI